MHWEPPPIQGENEDSNQVNIRALKQGFKKKNLDQELVKEKMDLTFSFKRKYLNMGRHPISEIKQEYPFLFDEVEVSIGLKEYQD